MKDYKKLLEKYGGYNWRGFVKECQEDIDMRTNPDKLAEAMTKKNPVNKKYTRPVTSFKTKAHTTWGLCRALRKTRMFDTDILAFLDEVMPKIASGTITLHQDGIIYWLTESEYNEFGALYEMED